METAGSLPSPQPGQPPPSVHPDGGTRIPSIPPGYTHMGTNRTPALDSRGAYQRSDFSEPRLLHLPMHRKELNSLT